MVETLGSARPFEQFVLLSVVELAAADETPAHSYEVTQTAKARLDEVARDSFGGVERPEVIAGLRSLTESDYLQKAKTTSTIGKGRPAYELAVDADAVLAELADTETVGPYVETLRA